MSDSPASGKGQDDKTEKSDKEVYMQIEEINSQVAQYRELLINIGQPRDGPELRENIRRLRQSCLKACKNTSEHILRDVRSRTPDIGIPVDCPNLALLYYAVRYFLSQLCKTKNLIKIVPMDMTGYFESRAGPSNIGNVISHIFLCSQIPDFCDEELCSIRADSKQIRNLIEELQEYMPYSDADLEKFSALQNGGRVQRVNGKHRAVYSKTNSTTVGPQASYTRGAFNFFCCAAKSNYV